MVNKKYLLLAGLCSAFLGQPAYAQESGSSTSAQWSSRDMTYRGQGYDVLDSSYYSNGRLDQYRRYMNHQDAFPPKPRNMWEVGVGGGAFNINGDVPSLWLTNGGGYGFHAHVRKAWGYVVSTRLQYIYGIGKGLDHDLASPQYVGLEPAWNGASNGYSYTANNQFVARNYRTEMHSLNFDIMGSINNINFHKARIKASLYGYIGLGFRAYKTRVDALDASLTPYGTAFQDQAGNVVDRGERRDIFDDILDGSYETSAFPNADADRTTMFDDKLVGFAPSIGAGAQFRLSKRINLAIEDRYSFGTGDDLLDGHRWSGQALTPGWDGLNYLSLGLNFNIGNSRTHVEPLYWMNPLDHAYNELSYPRHMILPDPVLPDSDGDGVTDQFDKCPGTPAGVAVDTHGCPMDTDGDGVPDDRDKELITPTYCQPVDADGVGKCPCPEGCGTVSACANIGAGSITFDNNSSNIRTSSQAMLATLAAQMQANPTCKVVITGSGNASKVQQQRSWDRVNRIIEYMSEKHGIDRNRFIFQYGQAGDANSVMYRSAMQGEEGPANVAPPFPNLRRD
ncbi:OmpA family protein [Polluticoccus soli]|uniref:OmpA family protein n=1 Tax=Polluticoccus soli TaxID=3034150 RepID=UPI0023E2C0F9|nr:hypothetical protein [Flavipsychrobacter sp. JY13-12]